MGDIILQCSGSTPGAVLSGNITVFLPVSVTNGGNAQADLLVDYGSGYVSTGITPVVNSQSISFNGFSVTAPPSGAVTLKISGIRANMFQLGPSATAQPIRASLSVPLQINQPSVIVAIPQTSLYTSLNDTTITCTGSPAPSALTISRLFAAGTAFASTRVTEGFASAFADPGTRILISYSGFPANAHIYVPDLVAGSDALTPTAAGDLGGTKSAGSYLPGSGTLLLARVADADSSGAGGTPFAFPTTGAAVALDSVSDVPLTGGAGYAVYQVVDSNPGLTETAQVPTFFGIPANSAPAQASETVSYAPVSDVLTASTAPVPRFGPVTPGSDCTALGDCTASYFPRLSVSFPSQEFTSADGKTANYNYIAIGNAGGGILNWTATVTYTNGSGWLGLAQMSGQGGGPVRTFVKPQGLVPGTYKASILIDAGPNAGNQSIPVTLTVLAQATAPSTPSTPSTTTPTPVQPTAVVTKVVNAATFEPTPLVAGSLGALFGSKLAGKNVSLTFDGQPAALLYAGDTQLNFQVPPGLASKESANMVVSVDGSSSAPVTVALAPAGPSIFGHGVLNQDNSSNMPQAAARSGSILQIFATGIPAGAPVSVQIGNLKDLVPVYAGGAPTLTGIQQVNVAVPGGLSAGSVPLTICATAGGQQYCSAAYALFVQ